MNILIPGIAMIATLLPLTSLHAETLEQAWATALSSDKALQSVQSRTAAAEAQLKAAKANRLPSIELDTTFTQLADSPTLDVDSLGLSDLGLSIDLPPMFNDDNFVTANARVTLPLYTSGLITSGINAAEASRDASVEQLQASVENLKLAVAEAFVLVLRATRGLEVTDSNVQSLQAHATDVQNMFRKGLVPQNDLLAVQVSLANAQQGALQASNALDVASAAYNRQLGRELDQQVSLEEVMPKVADSAMSAEIDALTDAALANRSEIDALAKASTAFRQQGKAERARARPQLGASAAYSYFENDVLDSEAFTTASVGVTWALFDGGKTRHTAAALDSKAQSFSEQQADLITQIELQVRSVWLSVTEVRQRLKVSEQALEQADENLKVAQNRYQNGIGTNTEVLDAETLRTLTQSNHNNARYDAALARLRLARAIGAL